MDPGGAGNNVCPDGHRARRTESHTNAASAPRTAPAPRANHGGAHRQRRAPQSRRCRRSRAPHPIVSAFSSSVGGPSCSAAFGHVAHVRNRLPHTVCTFTTPRTASGQHTCRSTAGESSWRAAVHRSPISRDSGPGGSASGQGLKAAGCPPSCGTGFAPVNHFFAATALSHLPMSALSAPTPDDATAHRMSVQVGSDRVRKIRAGA